jgi:NarL family two-component system response regulator LiaR
MSAVPDIFLTKHPGVVIITAFLITLNNMNKIKVLIADDHPPFTEGLTLLFEREPDLEVIATPTNGEEAVKLAQQLHPDVAILDVAMPGLNGIEAAKQIKATSPETAVLMLSAYGYEPYLLSSLQAGVSGYVLKSAPVSELTRAIRLVHDKQAIFDFEAMKKVLRGLMADTGTESKGPQGLHRRELEVLRLAAKGFSNKDIAQKLGIGTRTVQTHLLRIFHKLGVNSRTEAVFHALKKGWVTLDELP